MEHNNNKRIRRWSITWNNPHKTKEEFLEIIRIHLVKYAIVGEEKGDSGKLHFQCYVEYMNATTFEQMKNRFSIQHLEVAIASGVKNMEYCQKQKNYVEYGIKPRIIMSTNDMANEVLTYLIMGHDLFWIMEIDGDLTQYIIRNWKTLKDMENEIKIKGVDK